jgi:hypothetical protein
MKKLIILLLIVIATLAMANDDKKVTYQYVAGTEVTMTATPDSGWIFSHWTGDVTGTENPITITMTSDMEVVAHFFPVYRLDINVAGSGSIGIDATNDPAIW